MLVDETPSASGMLRGNFCAEELKTINNNKESNTTFDRREIILFWFRRIVKAMKLSKHKTTMPDEKRARYRSNLK